MPTQPRRAVLVSPIRVPSEVVVCQGFIFPTPRLHQYAMPTTAPQSTDAAELAQILQFVYKVLVFVRSSSTLKLFACLLVDAIGFSSFLLPGVGELGDVGWAPLQAWFLYFMFGSVRMSGLGFMEEILPGTDFVPSASIAWASENIDGPTLDALRTLTGVALRQR